MLNHVNIMFILYVSFHLISIIPDGDEYEYEYHIDIWNVNFINLNN